MACTQTLAGIVRDCLPNMGGIRAAYLDAQALNVKMKLFEKSREEKLDNVKKQAYHIG
jgi:hypothetical protein